MLGECNRGVNSNAPSAGSLTTQPAPARRGASHGRPSQITFRDAPAVPPAVSGDNFPYNFKGGLRPPAACGRPGGRPRPPYLGAQQLSGGGPRACRAPGTTPWSSGAAGSEQVVNPGSSEAAKKPWRASSSMVLAGMPGPSRLPLRAAYGRP